MIQPILINKKAVDSNQQATLFTQDKITKSTQKSETTLNTAATIDKLLLDLQPLIHFTALFLRLIQWKYNNNSKYSLLLLLFWVVSRSLHDFLLYILPITLLSVIVTLSHIYPSTTATIYQQHCGLEEEQRKRESLKEDLTEIYNVFYFIISVKEFIRKSDTICLLYHKHFSIATVKQRSTIYFVVACLFILAYVEWVVLIKQQIINSCAAILWFLILMIMCLHSPWVNPLLSAVFHISLPFVHLISLYDNKGSSIVNGDDIISDDDIPRRSQSKKDVDPTIIKTYCFEILHHQRWWFPAGWSNLLLPQDRPVWSDIHLEPTPSIHNFKLPPKTTYFVKPNEQRIVSWTWIDPSWSKKQMGEHNINLDKDGWQYGGWKWKSWSSQSSGLGICTRRQKWIRYAQRQEILVQLENISLVEQLASNDYTSLIGESDTTTVTSSITSSIYNWDDTTSTNSTVHSNYNCMVKKLPSPIPTLPSLPTLISNTLNPTACKSLHSSTFNTSIFLCRGKTYQKSTAHIMKDDPMYSKYCF